MLALGVHQLLRPWAGITRLTIFRAKNSRFHVVIAPAKKCYFRARLGHGQEAAGWQYEIRLSFCGASVQSSDAVYALADSPVGLLAWLLERWRAWGDSVVVLKELIDAADELRLLGNDAAHISAKKNDAIGPEPATLAIELSKEPLKAVREADNRRRL